MRCGGVPERSNGAVLKTVGRASASWVRIPPPPLRAAPQCAANPDPRKGMRHLRATPRPRGSQTGPASAGGLRLGRTWVGSSRPVGRRERRSRVLGREMWAGSADGTSWTPRVAEPRGERDGAAALHRRPTGSHLESNISSRSSPRRSWTTGSIEPGIATRTVVSGRRVDVCGPQSDGREARSRGRVPSDRRAGRSSTPSESVRGPAA